MLKLTGMLLRVYAYLCEALVCLAALAFSAVILGSPNQQIHLGWLPWTGEQLGAVLAVGGLAGLLLVLLAIAGRARILLTLFALTVLIIVARGFFFSAWKFSGADPARTAAWFVVALFMAFVGSIPAVGGSRAR